VRGPSTLSLATKAEAGELSGPRLDLAQSRMLERPDKGRQRPDRGRPPRKKVNEAIADVEAGRVAARIVLEP